ncbi:MAG: GNAT family N-acetyltransferase [Flavobacteriales bacterium]|nr:GNAT family N-acetyltransferase [Flavobacteriales bacterium]
MEVLRTERMLLREIVPADAPFFHELNADPEVMRWTGDEPFPDLAATEAFIRAYPAYRDDGFGRWAMVRLSDGEMLGWCGLRRQSDGEVDLGYRLFRRHWGQGYATEAALACVHHGFAVLGLPAIIGRAARANHASVRVLEKVGMRFWKEAPCADIADAVVYRVERP